MENKNKTGLQLKNLRVSKGFSLTTVAKKLNISVTTYREWENGRKIPVERLMDISALYSTSVSEILGQKQNANEEISKAIVCFEQGLGHIRKALSVL